MAKVELDVAEMVEETFKKYFGVTLDRLRELAEADKDGRCVVLDSPRKPLIWGDDEHNSCLCPECGFDLMGIPYGNQMVLQCPECGQYIDAKKCVTYAEAAESALKAGDHR